MAVKLTLYKDKMAKLEATKLKALYLTAEAIQEDIIRRQVVPLDTGMLQNSMSTTIVKQLATINFDTPYARRMYFHPEYNFKTDKNPHAQGRWLDYYIYGEGLKYTIDTFCQFMKQEMEKL